MTEYIQVPVLNLVLYPNRYHPNLTQFPSVSQPHSLSPANTLSMAALTPSLPIFSTQFLHLATPREVQSNVQRRRPLNSHFRNHPVRCTNASERQALFSRIAPVYDNLNDLLSLGQHRIWKRMAVSWTGAKMGDQVLDLCCGSGDLAFLLSEKVGSNGKVIGVDFSKEQLSIAASRQQIFSKAFNGKIEWVEGDATDLPFGDCYFDAITVGYGLRNVVDKQNAMQEMFRVLKPGAKVSVLDFNKSTQQFVSSFQEWMIDNAVVPVATSYGLAEEYQYLKSSIRQYLTGVELERLALEAGFSSAKHYEICGGLMGNLVATR